MAGKEKNCGFKTSIGGQALMEGILMRGPQKQAIVVRTKDGLVTKVEDITAAKDKSHVLGWPIIRGIVNLVASMSNGIKALTYSADFIPEEEQEEPSKFDLWVEKKLGSEKAEKILVSVSVFLGVALAIVLFMLLPTFIAGLFDGFIKSRLLNNLIEGVLRMGIFLLYMWLTSKMKDIYRVWQYHGAEHKTIFCYEAGLELTVENARTQSRQHPRCGTSFMFLVMFVSIIVFSLISWSSNTLIRMLIRILLLPVVIGICYELIKFAGRHDNWLTRIISAPGKALQKLTTKEPDDDMLEVAIEALKQVLPENEGEDRW